MSLRLSGRGSTFLLSVALVAFAYVPLALSRPIDVFWSPDQGGKLLQVLALTEGRLDLSLVYSGQWLDPDLLFQPYALSYVHNGAIQLPWPMAWALPSAFFYVVFGASGLVVLPVAGGILAAWSAGRLSEHMVPGSGPLAVLLSGLATPLLIYSTVFWEHSATAGVFTLGLLLVSAAGHRAAGKLLLAGCCFGLSIAWRNEASIFVVAAIAAHLAVRRRLPQAESDSTGQPSTRPWQNRGAGGTLPKQLLSIAAGLMLPLLPAAAYNWLITGRVYARTPALPGTAEQVLSRAPEPLWSVPADFLVGPTARVSGLDLAEPFRWMPLLGLVLLVAANRWPPQHQRIPRLAGLALAGSATAILLFGRPPHALDGALLAAPFLALALLGGPGLSSSSTARLVAIFFALAIPAYLLGVIFLHRSGFVGGGTQWGPRFLLLIYPPLAAVASAALFATMLQRRRAETLMGSGLVALSLAIQLLGLEHVDVNRNGWRGAGETLRSLPSGPIVIKPANILLANPSLYSERDFFRATSSRELAHWSRLAATAGIKEVWVVDWVGPDGGVALHPDPAMLPATDSVLVGGLKADRYPVVASP